MHVCMLHSMSTDSIRIDMVLHFHGQCSCSDQTRSCIICDQCPAHLQTQSQHLNLIQTLSRLINQPATRLADKSWAADAGAIGSLQNRPDKRLDLWPVEKPNKKTHGNIPELHQMGVPDGQGWKRHDKVHNFWRRISWVDIRLHTQQNKMQHTRIQYQTISQIHKENCGQGFHKYLKFKHCASSGPKRGWIC